MTCPVSAVIITHNEERSLGRCLTSLSWLPEIVIIDALSTDGTKALALDQGRDWSGKVRWLERQWTGFKDQRNYALSSATNPWVLVVDADEACSEDLKNRILGFFQNGASPPHRYWKIRRIEYFLGKAIQFGIWNPSYQDRFFFKEGVTYTNNIHEYPVFPAQPQDIHEPLLHWPDFEPEKFLFKMNKYTTVEAKDRVNRGQRTNAFRIFAAFPAMFLKNYFYYGAYKDGYHGFIISLLEGVSRVVRHVKIWQFQRQLPKK